MESAESVPLLELTTITDFYVDGLHRIEVVGENARMIYYRWRLLDGMWRRVASEFARVCPIRSLPVPLEKLPMAAFRNRPEARLHS